MAVFSKKEILAQAPPVFANLPEGNHLPLTMDAFALSYHQYPSPELVFLALFKIT